MEVYASGFVGHPGAILLTVRVGVMTGWRALLEYQAAWFS
jgi:hypothetical protein